MERMKGVVASFRKRKGFGFIRTEVGYEIFVHYSDIKSEGFKTLVEGEGVEFDVEETDRGKQARNVVRLNPPLESPLKSLTGDRSW